MNDITDSERLVRRFCKAYGLIVIPAVHVVCNNNVKPISILYIRCRSSHEFLKFRNSSGFFENVCGTNYDQLLQKLLDRYIILYRNCHDGNRLINGIVASFPEELDLNLTLMGF